MIPSPLAGRKAHSAFTVQLKVIEELKSMLEKVKIISSPLILEYVPKDQHPVQTHSAN